MTTRAINEWAASLEALLDDKCVAIAAGAALVVFLIGVFK